MAKATIDTAVWLNGFYPPTLDHFSSWQHEWSMGPHADPDWVWFRGDYYTEADARRVLAEKPDGVKGADEPSPRRGHP